MAEHWHKRQALCLAGQLPDNASDANAVICELQNLVDTWLHVAEPAPPSKVVSLASPRSGLKAPLRSTSPPVYAGGLFFEPEKGIEIIAGKKRSSPA